MTARRYVEITVGLPMVTEVTTYIPIRADIRGRPVPAFLVIHITVRCDRPNPGLPRSGC